MSLYSERTESGDLGRHMHHLVPVPKVGGMTILMGKAFQCTTVLGEKKLYFQ